MTHTGLIRNRLQIPQLPRSMKQRRLSISQIQEEAAS